MSNMTKLTQCMYQTFFRWKNRSLVDLSSPSKICKIEWRDVEESKAYEHGGALLGFGV
jgi:hypothetical protein